VPNPQVSVTPTSGELNCSMSRVLLTASVTGGEAPYSYQWYKDGTPIAGATGATYEATQAGTYHVVVTDANGCTDDSNETVVTEVPTPIGALAITKVVEPPFDQTPVGVGDVIHYTVRVSNPGPVDLTDVDVTDSRIPILAGPVGDDGDGVLEPGGIWTYTGTYTVTQRDMGSIIANTATATAVDPCGRLIASAPAVTRTPCVNCVDNPPAAQDQTVITCMDVPLNLTLVGRDPDLGLVPPTERSLSFSILGAPLHGTISGNLTVVSYTLPDLASVNVTYTPAPGFVGTDAFTFMVQDPYGLFATATVLINVDRCGQEEVAGAAGAAASPVVINEVAWGGTNASPEDQWIELANTTDQAIDLTGWILRWRRKQPATPEEAKWKVVELRGEIPAHGYYLLERRHDNVVSDISADLVYDTEPPHLLRLSGLGEVMELVDPDGNVVDMANADNPNRDGWAGGSGAPHPATMERIDPASPDRDDNWTANRGIVVNGFDARKALLTGTAGATNEETVIQGVGPGIPQLVRQGERIAVFATLPAPVHELKEVPRVTLALVDGVAGGAGAFVAPEVQAGAVSERRLPGTPNCEVLVDTSRLAPGTYRVWITLGPQTFLALTIQVIGRR
ncbi:MAG: lamin tail domain-containing protein, partial [Candidatus Acetothermia bacterium]|nr:lamin tail domain-containing protein [Candidatus Acetothermia bacterium]